MGELIVTQICRLLVYSIEYNRTIKSKLSSSSVNRASFRRMLFPQGSNLLAQLCLNMNPEFSKDLVIQSACQPVNVVIF